MTSLHPQFITDNNGKKISAVISMNEFYAILEELEDIEDIKLYDDAKKEDDNERISLSEYVKNRANKNA